MKKKFNFWLNIVTICFCICAIAVGVYSATTAQITASGKVGFVAHGCDVDVTGQIYGHAAENKADGLPVKEAQAEDLNGGEAVEVRGNAQTLPIGDRYFSDMESNDGKPADIVITLTITNVSKFAVTATVDETATQKPSDAITVSFDQTKADLQANNGTVTFKITISMSATNGLYAELKPIGNNFSITIEFDRYSSYMIDNNKLYACMGTDQETGNAIRWLAIAKNGVSLKNVSFTSLSQMTAGDYVFISEYLLENADGGYHLNYNTADVSNNYGANYNGSTIQRYINGTGEGTLSQRYNFSSSELFSKLNKITFDKETIVDSETNNELTLPATTDQSFWLLSYNEYLSYLGEGDVSAIAYLLNTTTASSWWLRSVKDVDSDIKRSLIDIVLENGCSSFGHCSYPGNTIGIRPAFAITIK